MTRKILLAVTFFGLPAVAVSIVMRHDVDLSAYQKLAAGYPEPLVINVTETGSADGMGVWIAPNWILTAAHVAVGVQPGDRIGPGRTLNVVRVAPHPDWPDAPIDVGLIRVEAGQPEAEFVQICAPGEVEDQEVVFMGAGDFGDGVTGPAHADGRMRAARNTVVFADASLVAFVFDGPDSGQSLPLEGISGPGDSGGPAYVESKDGICVLAVSSGQDTEPTGGKEGRYGVVEFYARVDVLRNWIDSVVTEAVGPVSL